MMETVFSISIISFILFIAIGLYFNKVAEKREEERRKNLPILKSSDVTTRQLDRALASRSNNDSFKITIRKKIILERDSNTCYFCRRTDADNVVYNRGLTPIEVIGALDPDRLITICDKCRLDKVSPQGFEELVANIYEKNGFSVKRTGGRGDEGIDLILLDNKTGEKIIVQCKRLKGSVGVGVVRDFYGTLINSKVNRGYIVTTNRYTSGAISFAKGKSISLKRFKDLP